MCGSFKLVIHENSVMCKILPMTFKKSVRVQYNNFESNSIRGFNDLCTKLVMQFNNNILA